METKAVPLSQVKSRMRARGISQAQFGQVAGIAQPHVSAILRGRRPVGVERMRDFAKTVVLLQLDRDVDVKPEPDEPAIDCPIRIRQL